MKNSKLSLVLCAFALCAFSRAAHAMFDPEMIQETMQAIQDHNQNASPEHQIPTPISDDQAQTPPTKEPVLRPDEDAPWERWQAEEAVILKKRAKPWLHVTPRWDGPRIRMASSTKMAPLFPKTWPYQNIKQIRLLVNTYGKTKKTSANWPKWLKPELVQRLPEEKLEINTAYVFVSTSDDPNDLTYLHSYKIAPGIDWKRSYQKRVTVNGKHVWKTVYGSTPTSPTHGDVEPVLLQFNKMSSTYDAEMPYAIFFSDGEALHFDPPSSAGYGHPASHGCVREPWDEAYWVFNYADAFSDKFTVRVMN